MPGRSELRETLALQRERLHRWRHLRSQTPAADAAVQAAAQGWMAAQAAPATPPAHAPPRPGATELTETVLQYLWQAQQRALAPGATLAYYRGAPSIYGARNDGIEGVTRLLPLWAAALHSGFGPAGRREAMRQHLHTALLNGCASGTRHGWGAITDRSTLICEAADVALALWLSRHQVWDRLTPAQRDSVAAWLRQCLGRETADNNWHLFVATVDAALAALVPGHVFSSQARLARVFSFARSDGCFVDGPQGQVDLYNAWGFHYHLFWINQMQPGLLPAQADEMLGTFCGWYQYLFTQQGVPLWGRSLCYRMAVAAPLLASVQRRLPGVQPADAEMAYACSLGYLAAHGGLRHGRPTQGVLGEDLRWLDAYSGPASSLWGCRAMVLYLAAPPGGGAPPWPQHLPAERETVQRDIPALGARLLTDPERGQVQLSFTPARAPSQPHTRPEHAWRHRARQWLYARASRPAARSTLGPAGEVTSCMNRYA